MQFLKRFTLIALVLMLSALAIIPVAGQDNGAKARFVHAIPGASAVDIYVDGQLAVSSLAFGSATDYIALPAGDHALTVTQEGATTALWEQSLTFADQSASTLIASSIEPLEFTQYTDDLNPLPLGKSRFTAIHAIADADPVDVILATGQPVIPGLTYNQPYGTLDLPAMTYDLAVVPVGDSLENALIAAATYALDSGTSYVALAYGTANDPQALLLSAPTNGDGQGGALRLVHGVADAPAVDVYVNDVLLAPALAFGELTEYVALPAGEYTVNVSVTGSGDNVASGSVSVGSGDYVSAIVLGSASAPELQTFSETFGTVSSTESALYVINALSGVSSVTASLTEGAGLIADLASGTAQSALVAPTTEDIILGINTNDASGVQPLDLPGGVYGGVVYTAILVDGGEVIVDMASIAQDLSSAPVSAVATPGPTLEPTAAPTEAAAAPTAAPEILPTATLAVPAATAPAAFTGPTAQIMLNPGANLHLREYPRPDARSLGLAPSGAILLVLGREGEPGPVAGLVPTPTTTPFVDPVTLLEDEDTDLVPEETWLYVTYITPDGGSITAWVNAQFLALSDADGETFMLRELLTIPSNRYGFASNTAIQPPTERQSALTVTIVGVDPSANVHIRRTPTSEGESLARIPNGTVLDFLGLNEAQDWAFVRYTSPDGGALRGWVNTSFISYQRNGQPTTIEELVTREELVTVADEERGDIEVQPQAAAPTATPLRDAIVGEVIGLDPGANLHMRRRPSATSESIALLPNGTTLVITAQSVDTDGRIWLETTYQDQTGWVWAQYIQLSFNGRSFEVTAVPTLAPTPTGTPTEAPAGG
ncbi:MAG: DUF4397 domain-containing protein [Chloroflexi bacterium]|uniref:DUF4397 domain-containing protein n=1 Tax=Candidatus Flexifilum breve TaxID=3140694 RepID=UPI003135960A|nr:DUF4397 domain-containing protein [Chloroflexota bacterium]